MVSLDDTNCTYPVSLTKEHNERSYDSDVYREASFLLKKLQLTESSNYNHILILLQKIENILCTHTHENNQPRLWGIEAISKMSAHATHRLHFKDIPRQ